MDLAAPLRPEVLRPIVTLILPGTIAVGPYVLLLGTYVPSIAQFWDDHAKAFAVFMLLIILAAGFVLDDSGTIVEKKCIDRWLQKKRTSHDADWKGYLKLQLNDEIVGQRYLRNKYTQLKFELSMSQSLIVFWIGLLWLQLKIGIWSTAGFILASIALIVGAAAFFGGSLLTASLLSETRSIILEAVAEGPKGISARRVK